MKELSIEQKARRYDEALKVLHKYDGANIMFSQSLKEEMFPELKESEDERIKKELINYFKENNAALAFRGISNESVIAWLEKQGYKDEEILVLKDQIESLHAAIRALKEAHKIEFKKQGEQKPVDVDYNPFDDFRKSDSEINPSEFDARLNTLLKEFESLPKEELVNSLAFYLNVVQNDGTYNEQKPADKVEPKFCEGDWVVNNNGEPQFFQVTFYSWPDSKIKGKDNLELFINSATLDKQYHLWTIQDAKPGDVLLSPSTPEGDKECPFIFKEIDKSGIVRFYAALLQSEKLKIADGITNVMGYANAGYHTPATKEQRDMLFKKMKEAGYEWDAEKKELKLRKVEQKPQRMVSAEAKEALYDKPAWSEEDEKMLKDTIRFCELCGNQVSVYWLKSLRPQNRWKPSDEHIKVCKEVYADILSAKGFDLGTVNGELNRLEEQLNKLREE